MAVTALRAAALASAFAAALATPALAQVDFGGSYGVALGSSLTGTAMMNSAIPRPSFGPRRPQPAGPVLGAAGEEGLRERMGGRLPYGAGGYVPAARGPADTRYRTNPAVTDKVKRQFVDWVARRSPSDAQMVRSDLDRVDVPRAWAGVVASDGLRPGDVADALASYWIINWMIATGGDNDRAQSQAVRDQVRPMIAQNPGFARLSIAQRQEMAETLMLNFMYQHDVYLHAVKAGDRALKAKLADAAIARFRNEMGVDLRSLALTDQGFVKRG